MKNKSRSFVCSAIPFFPAQNDTQHTITQVRWQHLCPLAAKWAEHRVPWARWRESWVLPDWLDKKIKKTLRKAEGLKTGSPDSSHWQLMTSCNFGWPKGNLGQALRQTRAALRGHFGWSQELLCGLLWVESQGYLGCSTIATVYVKTLRGRLQAWYPRWSILYTSLDRGTAWHQANFTLQQWKSLQWQSERPHIPKGAPPDSSRSHCKWRFWFCLNKRNEWG